MKSILSFFGINCRARGNFATRLLSYSVVDSTTNLPNDDWIATAHLYDYDQDTLVLPGTSNALYFRDNGGLMPNEGVA